MKKFFGVLIFLLVACQDPPQPPALTISGRVGLGASLPSATRLQLADVVPGRLLVRFKNTNQVNTMPVNTMPINTMAVKTLFVNDTTLELKRQTALSGLSVYRSATLEMQNDALRTVQLAKILSQRNDVLYAIPERRMHPTSLPNDSGFVSQWALANKNIVAGSINWTPVFTGNNNLKEVAVAVIDTGVINHPDLNANLLPGYDFVASDYTANDANTGRDNDPTDTDTTSAEYHGTHVAGIIAATTNNNLGVAGVAWNAKLIPVRALGVGGGVLSDVLDAMLWSAGIAVSGVPTNTHPADIINLSLGGRGSCSQAETDVITQILKQPQHPSIVVAAGNEGVLASTFSPGSCAGVITVTANNRAGSRTNYANYGSRVDVMAPGGDSTGGILSLGLDSSSQQPGYVYQSGTSMAAAFVSGLAALLKGAKPELDNVSMLQLLQSTSGAVGPNNCGRAASDCGAGIINVTRALSVVTGAPDPDPPAPDFMVVPETTSVSLLRDTSTTLKLFVRRSNAYAAPVSVELTSQLPALNIGFNASTTTGSEFELTITPQTNLLDGVYTLNLRFTGAAAPLKNLSLQLLRLPVTTANLDNAIVVAVPQENSVLMVEQAKTLPLKGNLAYNRDYTFLEMGTKTFLMLGFKDTNNNKQFDDGDYVGVYSLDGQKFGIVQAPSTDINFDLELQDANHHPLANLFGNNITEKGITATINAILARVGQNK